MDADPADALPSILEPLLDYLYSVLPPPLDNILTTALSHGITLARSLISIAIYMASSHPSTWDAQTILPPLISLLAAYLALLSLYRTTSWMIRTSIWFIKWGSIVAALFAGLGFMAGNVAMGGDGPAVLGNLGLGNIAQGGPGGIARAVGGMLWKTFSGEPNARSTRSRARKPARKEKPGAWDTFAQHAQHRFQQEQDNAGSGPEVTVDEEDDVRGAPVDAQKIMGQIMGYAGRMGWLDTMKGVMGDATQAAAGDGAGTDNGERRKPPRRKAKAGTSNR